MAKRNSTPPGRQSAPHASSERRIKVGRGFYERKRGNAVSSYVSQPVPWIRLQGHWLAKAGFVIDTRIRVKVTRGCLMITVDGGVE